MGTISSYATAPYYTYYLWCICGRRSFGGFGSIFQHPCGAVNQFASGAYHGLSHFVGFAWRVGTHDSSMLSGGEMWHVMLCWSIKFGKPRAHPPYMEVGIRGWDPSCSWSQSLPFFTTRSSICVGAQTYLWSFCDLEELFLFCGPRKKSTLCNHDLGHYAQSPGM